MEGTLYDTWPIERPGNYAYFQEPDGRGKGDTNLVCAGSLSYPMTFETNRLIIESDKDFHPARMRVRFCIGEDTIIDEPLSKYSPGIGKRHEVTFDNVTIPPVQNFRVYLKVNSPLSSKSMIKVHLARAE